jgi:hypothetical protein
VKPQQAEIDQMQAILERLVPSSKPQATPYAKLGGVSHGQRQREPRRSLTHALVSLAVATTALAGCGIGFRRALTTDELPAGTCPRATLKADESCTASAREYAVGATVGSPRGHGSDLGGTAWFRWPLFDVALDERTVRSGTIDHHSLAGGVGTHLRPMILWPEVNRYVDVLANLGFDLGVIGAGSHIEGRGDAYIAGALDLFAPDVGPFRYLDTGVPGVRVGVRYTAYVQGWASETTFEVGLIWRWGVAIDLYRHWTLRRTGD